MKTTLSILTVLMLAGIVAFFVGCNSQKPSTNEVIVMRDVTSRQLTQPQAGEIVPLFGLTNDKWNGAIFHFMNITDISLSQDTTVSISPENQWNGNEIERNNAIATFNNGVTGILANAQKDTIGRGNSFIYVPLAYELNLLAQSPAQRRILVVYSDLMENTWDISFYKPKTLNSLQSNPALLTKYFASKVPLGNLTGIEVYLIFQPANTLEDYQFRVVSTFYRQMLTAAGAKVTVAANLQN